MLYDLPKVLVFRCWQGLPATTMLVMGGLAKQAFSNKKTSKFTGHSC
jgi:hypothetical protein